MVEGDRWLLSSMQDGTAVLLAGSLMGRIRGFEPRGRGSNPRPPAILIQHKKQRR